MSDRTKQGKQIKPNTQKVRYSFNSHKSCSSGDLESSLNILKAYSDRCDPKR